MQVPRKELLLELVNVAEELGRTPTPEEIGEYAEFDVSTYRSRFGSYHQAVTAAGLEQPTYSRIPTVELLAELRRVAEEIDSSPTQKDMAEQSGYSVSPYQARFGSWSRAVLAAGYRPNPGELSRSTLIAELQRLAEAIDRRPTQADMNERGAFSSGVYVKKFGSWNNALEGAGFAPRTKFTKIPTEELLLELGDLRDKLDRPLTSKDMNQQGRFSSGTYVNRFGSWKNALVAADIEPPEQTDYSREALLSELDSLAEELGETPRMTDMDEHGEYSALTYWRTFGSWAQAIEEAGLPPRNTSSKIPESELLAELERLATGIGDVPTTSDMQNHGAYSPGTYINRFGSWQAALDKTGLSE